MWTNSAFNFNMPHSLSALNHSTTTECNYVWCISLLYACLNSGLSMCILHHLVFKWSSNTRAHDCQSRKVISRCVGILHKRFIALNHTWKLYIVVSISRSHSIKSIITIHQERFINPSKINKSQLLRLKLEIEPGIDTIDGVLNGYFTCFKDGFWHPIYTT